MMYALIIRLACHRHRVTGPSGNDAPDTLALAALTFLIIWTITVLILAPK